MKKITILLILMAIYGRGYGQFSFDPTCTDYLVNFCRTLLVSTSECKQWTGQCKSNLNISREGGVMIGAKNLLDSRLAVSNGVISTSLRILNGSPWPDYVFDKSYNLMPLQDVKTFIEKNKHLPNTLSTSDIYKNGGVEIGATFTNHQEKIEEIFLHLIELEKQAKSIQKENEDLDKAYINLTLQLIDQTIVRKMLSK